MIEIVNNLNYKKPYSRDFNINSRIIEILKNENILDIFITTQERAYVLNITYENKNYEVIKNQYTILSKNIKQRTDVVKNYISLTNEGIIYYIPYKQ